MMLRNLEEAAGNERKMKGRDETKTRRVGELQMSRPELAWPEPYLQVRTPCRFHPKFSFFEHPSQIRLSSV